MTINQPPLQPTPVGALRFNTDSSKMEYYDGNQWVNVTSTSPDAHTGGTRGLTMGGYTSPTFTNVIDYVTIATTGNSVDFGDLNALLQDPMAVASRTRGISGGGVSAPTTTYVNTIQAVTISTTGDAVDVGDLTVAKRGGAPMSSSTRGLFTSGDTPTLINSIDYITIATAGDAIDFGDLTYGTSLTAGFASPTRGLIGGGNLGINTISYVTIATLGNGADFGDLNGSRRGNAGSSNAVRGIWGAGLPSPGNTDYSTIATLGNSLDFGDLTNATNWLYASMSSSTRAVFTGGYNPSTNAQYSTMDYFQIMTTGDAIDFGDLTSARHHFTACSNGHGGLG